MRLFALSDLHIDYDANASWIANLSRTEYTDDILIVAGDIAHHRSLLAWCITELSSRFHQVLFVPGNHDLWIIGEPDTKDSLQKFHEITTTIHDNGASMRPYYTRGIYIAPLLGWYDYSFGQPSNELAAIWMDYRACRWPEGYDHPTVAHYFAALNRDVRAPPASNVITFSHFLPRIDLLPSYVPKSLRILDPVLGSNLIESQLRSLRPSIHVYGHSHISQSVLRDGIHYVNNALGYPQEYRTSANSLHCIYEM